MTKIVFKSLSVSKSTSLNNEEQRLGGGAALSHLFIASKRDTSWRRIIWPELFIGGGELLAIVMFIIYSYHYFIDISCYFFVPYVVSVCFNALYLFVNGTCESSGNVRCNLLIDILSALFMVVSQSFLAIKYAQLYIEDSKSADLVHPSSESFVNKLFMDKVPLPLLFDILSLTVALVTSTFLTAKLYKRKSKHEKTVNLSALSGIADEVVVMTGLMILRIYSHHQGQEAFLHLALNHMSTFYVIVLAIRSLIAIYVKYHKEEDPGKANDDSVRGVLNELPHLEEGAEKDLRSPLTSTKNIERRLPIPAFCTFLIAILLFCLGYRFPLVRSLGLLILALADRLLLICINIVILCNNYECSKSAMASDFEPAADKLEDSTVVQNSDQTSNPGSMHHRSLSSGQQNYVSVSGEEDNDFHDNGNGRGGLLEEDNGERYFE